MGLFDPGQSTQTATPGALAPADIASRLFAIKMLLAAFAQGGGAPQTLGEYMKSGPRKLPSGVTGDASSALMTALQQPGAFTRGPSTVKTKGASPSTFQEIAGILPLLLMANSIGSGTDSSQLSIQDQMLAKALGIDPSTLKGPTHGQTVLDRLGGGLSGLGGKLQGLFSGSQGSLGDYGMSAGDPSQSSLPDLNFDLSSYNDPGYGVMDTSGTGDSFLASLLGGY